MQLMKCVHRSEQEKKRVFVGFMKAEGTPPRLDAIERWFRVGGRPDRS
jgi:hypothetical protein